MNWDSLINIGIGFLIGYGLCLGRSAKRTLKSAEREARKMYVATIRSLAERSRHAAQVISEQSKAVSESDLEMASRMAFARAQANMADELEKMARKVES